jgi:hypothetical protein
VDKVLVKSLVALSEMLLLGDKVGIRLGFLHLLNHFSSETEHDSRIHRPSFLHLSLVDRGV